MVYYHRRSLFWQNISFGATCYSGLSNWPEAARTLIDEEIAQGKTITEIRGNEIDFQWRVMKLKLKIEAELPLEEIIFLDRGMPDSIAYFQLLNLDPQEARDVCYRGLYRKVFLMEPFMFKKDYARTESPEEVARLNNFLRDAYEQLGYEVIVVPVAAFIEDRARFILERM